MNRPRVDRTGAAQRDFEQAARAAGLDPSDRWVDDYATYEWDHLRPALNAYGLAVAGRRLLEFGCNVGGSSVVLAALGARLSAIDIDPALVAVARANLVRHGLDGAIECTGKGDALPYAAASFDVILANSVFEYVAPDRLDRVVLELHRVLRPGGLLFVCGTASRLALRERHSRRWLVNLLPRAIDRLTGRPLQRGLAPWRLARSLRGHFAEVGGDGWLEARRAIHGRLTLPVRAYAEITGLTGRSPGWFAPYIELLLRKT